MKTIVITFLITIFFFHTIEATAQWVHLNETFDSAVSVTTIKAFGNKLLVATSNSAPKQLKIYESSDSGQTWIPVDSINDANEYGRFAVLGNILFVLHVDSGLYKSLDSGKTWSNLFYLPNSPFNAITIKDSIIIVGMGDGRLYQSLDTGLTWNLTGNTSCGLYCLISNSTNIFASACELLTSTDGGTNWFVVDSVSNFGFMAIKGTYIFASDFFKVYRTSNNGINWTDVVNNLCSGYPGYSFCISNSNLLYATHDAYGISEGVYVTTNNGQIWEKTNLGLGQVSVNGFDTLDNYIFAATNNGIYRIDTSQVASIPCDTIYTYAYATIPSCKTCSDGTATINIPCSSTPPYTFIWYTSPVQTTQTITGLSSGTYTFCITDSNSCTGCSSVFVNDTNDIVTVSNISGNLFFSIFPNPAHDYLTVDFGRNISKAEVIIFNVLGVQEVDYALSGESNRIDVSKLTDGIYFLEIITGDKISRQKFIKG